MASLRYLGVMRTASSSSSRLWRESILGRSWSRSLSTPAASSSEVKDTPFVVEASKKNLPQSPWKMNFLVKLVRGKWVPDALAQLKFSPKRRCEDVSKVVQRAVSIATQNYQTIPEELMIKEIFITKGFAQKRSRIMGRGRTGYGYRRASHVTVKVEKVDFEDLMTNAKSTNSKAKWEKRLALVNDIKAGTKSSIAIGADPNQSRK